jgi:hypothetical protein
VWLSEQSFRRKYRTVYSRSRRHSVCTWCEQERGDEKKRQDRFRDKARWTLATHTKRYNRRFDTKLTQGEFAREFGWTIEIMARDAERAYEHECLYCKVSFADMDANGLDNLTLDINDPRELPYYGSNTRWICRTCNLRKGDKTPTEWAAMLIDYEQRKQELAAARSAPQEHGLLFWPGDVA